MTKPRPDPEKLLKRLEEEERHQLRGKLKIYLGAAPGVGKTYTMLRDAAAQLQQGVDVVIGVIESHGRTEVEALLKGFEILPRQSLNYRGQSLQEFDLDHALSRNMQIILMDEMAHTNVPGLRHAKRWQDIKELLDRGINVYTTLNVQHIESLNDVVTQILHTPIKETVPDSMVDVADSIELIDLPPEDLLKRLQDGKVYIPQQAELAAEHFFRKGNLIALRELALRVTAERVSAQVLSYRQGQDIKYIWPTKERILVCVGASPDAVKLIRVARRLATSLQASWVAVHVEDIPTRTSPEQRQRIIQNMRLAEQLGAETKMLAGTDIVKELTNYAREANIGKIIIGKHIRPQWQRILFRSLTDELVRKSDEIDVYIVTYPHAEPRVSHSSFLPRINLWRGYLWAFCLVGITTMINGLLCPYFDRGTVVMIYLLSVTLMTFIGRMGPAIFSAILSLLSFQIFFTYPLYSLKVDDIREILPLGLLLTFVLIISYISLLSVRKARSAYFAERQTASLHNLSRQLATTRSVDKLLQIAMRYLAELFDAEVLAFLPDDEQLKVVAGFHAMRQLNDKEKAVAHWVYQMGQPAGKNTHTLPYAEGLYIPLLASEGTIGVLRLQTHDPDYLFTPEQMHLLESLANQLALAIEVDRLHEQTRKDELRTEADEVRRSLLQVIARDISIPLLTTLGAANNLIENSNTLTPERTKQLGIDIYFELEQLNRSINNLLQVSYLEEKTITLQKKPCSIITIIENSKHSLARELGNKPIHIHCTEKIPLIPVDNSLMQEVFVNLIDNAIKFTPQATSIDIDVGLKDDMALITVRDHGSGIDPNEMRTIFEQFYRGRLITSQRGIGLGLAICRSIIQAHGGEIWAENHREGGAVFSFTLPLDERGI